MTATVYFTCPHCGTLMKEEVDAKGGDNPTVICDDDSCGNNFEIKLTIE